MQVIDNVVNLVGGIEMGLPLPEKYLKENSNVQVIDITDLNINPKLGQHYFEGKLYTDEEWIKKFPIDGSELTI
jgi:hypothetical protein